MIKIITFLIVSLVIPIILVGEIDAQIVSKTHTREFTIRQSYLQVKEIKQISVLDSEFRISQGSVEGFSVFVPVEMDPERSSKLQDTLNSVSIKDSQGRNLPYDINQTLGGNYEVRISNLPPISFGNPYSISLEYDSYGLLVNTGAVKDIFIPGFPSQVSRSNTDVKETVSTRVIIPPGLQSINITSPSKEPVQRGEDLVIDYTLEELSGISAWIQLGKEQFFTFEIDQIIPPTSGIPFAINTLTVPLPRDIRSGPISQTVYYTEISPEPISMHLDDDGNLIAQFKSSASKPIELKVRGYASLKQDSVFEFSNSGFLADIPATFDRYLEPAQYWEVDHPSIRDVALQLKGNEVDVDKIIQNTFNYVVDLIDYSFVKKYGVNDRQGALETLNGGAAVCMEYSDLFIALLRAQGVPARAAFGYGYGVADFEALQENTINHQWAEVYLPAQDTWINIDTTWGEYGNYIPGGDLNHFYSHVSSIDPLTPSTTSLSFFGELAEVPDRDMKILIVGEMPNAPARSIDVLLAEYPVSDDGQGIWSSLAFQNQIIDEMVGDLFGTESPLVINLFKVFVVISPVILMIMIYILIKSMGGGKKKVQPIPQRSQIAQVPQPIRTPIPEYRPDR